MLITVAAYCWPLARKIFQESKDSKQKQTSMTTITFYSNQSYLLRWLSEEIRIYFLSSLLWLSLIESFVYRLYVDLDASATTKVSDEKNTDSFIWPVGL